MSAIALIRPIASTVELLKNHDEVAKLIQEALKDGVDYGVIPGTGDKPALFKPGAERLCAAFGAHPEYELVQSELDHNLEVDWIKRRKIWRKNGERGFDWGEENGHSLGLYRYRYRCKIVLHDGRVIGTAEGVCSTMESKYIDRPRDSENTVCKMSQKRAFVAATLHAFALSSRFTQDIEDMDRDTFVDAQPAKRQQTKPEQAAPRPGLKEAAPPPQAAPPQTPAGRGSLYDPGNPTQRAVIIQILRKREVPEAWHAAIHDGLTQRPSGDLNAVIEEVGALMEAAARAAPMTEIVEAEYTEGPF